MEWCLYLYTPNAKRTVSNSGCSLLLVFVFLTSHTCFLFFSGIQCMSNSVNIMEGVCE